MLPMTVARPGSADLPDSRCAELVAPGRYRRLLPLAVSVLVIGVLTAAAVLYQVKSWSPVPGQNRSGAADPSAGRPPAGAAAPSGDPATVTGAWPSARPVSTPAKVPDGTTFTPLIYLNVLTAVGTAATPDGTTLRLVVRVGSNAPVELHRLPAEQSVQFPAFAAAGDELVWAEVTEVQGRTDTQLWRANWRTPALAEPLTADTGDIVFFNSQYDLVVVDGRVYWAAVAHSAASATEVRSVPLAGGTVTTRLVNGGYALSAWPWLVSAAGGAAEPVQLLNLDTGQRVQVSASPTELVACSPTWCRAFLLSSIATEAPRIELMRPDGTQRRPIGADRTSVALQDVALLDRFELVLQDSDASIVVGPRLLLYDLTTGRLLQVATDVDTVQARGGLLWWSTASSGTDRWYCLDLRTLG